MKTFNHTWLLLIAIASSLWIPFTVPEVWRENSHHGLVVTILGLLPLGITALLWLLRRRVQVYVATQSMLVACFIAMVGINVSAHINHSVSLVTPWASFISFPVCILMLWWAQRLAKKQRPQPINAPYSQPQTVEKR